VSFKWHECAVLCHDLLDAVEQFQGATGIRKLGCSLG
jgi:hypothetical protein